MARSPRRSALERLADLDPDGVATAPGSQPGFRPVARNGRALSSGDEGASQGTDPGRGAPGVVVPSGPVAPLPAPDRTEPSTPRRWLRAVLVAALCAVLVLGAAAAYGLWRYGQLERVEVPLAQPSGRGDVWLLVGSDSREGIDPSRPDAPSLLGEEVGGRRADTVMLMRELQGGGHQLLSLPRDLWFDPPGEGNATRLNGAYNRGPAALVELIGAELGIGVHHYVEIDLAGLDRVVDAVGGVTLELPTPGYDETVGLFLTDPGPVTLDGARGLAYVRSRHWVDLVEGQARPDGRGDLGRVERQQRFLVALGDRLLASRNPVTLDRVARSLVTSVRVDEDMGVADLIELARILQQATPGPGLPVSNHVTAGGAQVLLLDSGAEPILDVYRP